MGAHGTAQDKTQTMWYTRDNPEKSYASGTGGKQNHHILPCSSVKRSLLEAAQSNANLLDAVKFFSKWNINKTDNLVMLPTFKVFMALFGKKGGKQGVNYVPVGVNKHACHDRGHPLYTDNARIALNDVWGLVNLTLDKHGLLEKADDIGGELDSKITSWKKKVTNRSTTQAKWRDMVNGDDSARKNFYMAVP